MFVSLKQTANTQSRELKYTHTKTHWEKEHHMQCYNREKSLFEIWYCSLSSSRNWNQCSRCLFSCSLFVVLWETMNSLTTVIVFSFMEKNRCSSHSSSYSFCSADATKCPKWVQCKANKNAERQRREQNVSIAKKWWKNKILFLNILSVNEQKNALVRATSFHSFYFTLFSFIFISTLFDCCCCWFYSILSVIFAFSQC